jgi:hypothetical protein
MEERPGRTHRLMDFQRAALTMPDLAAFRNTLEP